MDDLLSPITSTLPEKELSEIRSFVLTYFGRLANFSGRELEKELTNMLVFGFSPVRLNTSIEVTDAILKRKINSTLYDAITKKRKKPRAKVSKGAEMLERDTRISRYVAPESVHHANKLFSDNLIFKMATPFAEKIARRYAESIMTKHEVSIQDIADDVGATASQVKSIISREQFPVILQKYLPLEETMERHKELMSQDKDLAVAAKMVELSYKAHGKLGDKGEKPKSDFASFLQQINVYGGTNEGESRQPVVEITKPVQNQNKEGGDSYFQAEQSAEGVFEERNEQGRDIESSSDGDFDSEASSTS